MIFVFVLSACIAGGAAVAPLGGCLCLTGNNVNVRDGPCGSVIGQASQRNGDCFNYKGGSKYCQLGSSWYTFLEVDFNGQSGWMADSLLSEDSASECPGSVPTLTDCVCVTANVNVRDAACGAVLGSASSANNDCFELLGGSQYCQLGSSWYTFWEVDFNGQSGWMANSYLSGSPSSSCAGVASGCSAVTVISRSEWNARSFSGQSTSLNTPLSKAFVHHSAGAPCFSQSSCISTVQGIQNYHMDSNGWSDIGYNFLIGEDGQVYEGRGWEIQGAHCTGWNSQAIGICIMGTFTEDLPNTAALDALQNLLDCGVSQGYLTSAYTLHGHRDGKVTTCPGDTLYNLLTGWPRYGGSLL